MLRKIVSQRSRYFLLMDGSVNLHFKDGCLKTEITLRQDALIATKLRIFIRVPSLTNHAKGKKHIAIVDKRKSFFKPKSES